MSTARTRFTIDLDPQFDSKLTAVASSKGITKAEVIRRALATYSFLTGQISADDGRKLSITDKSDRVMKEIVLP